MNPCEYLDEKKEDLNFLEGDDKYHALIEYGDLLKEAPEKTRENKVPGCTSGVYISTEFKHGKMYFKGTSESVIVKGYLAILVKALSGHAPEEIIHAEACVEKFAKETDIKSHLTPNRSNAFGNIYKFIKEKALKEIN